MTDHKFNILNFFGTVPSWRNSIDVRLMEFLNGQKIMVVTAAYGADQVRQVAANGRCCPVIASAGADGVEIRRELFNSEELQAACAG